MFKHNLLLIYRNFRKHKSTFLINLIGLSCGLACVLVIYLWVNDELSFDKYHVNDSRLYQVMTNIKSEKGIDTRKDTPHLLTEMLPLEMPEVEYAATVTPDLFFPAFTLSANDKKIKGTGKFASKDFFKIFSYNLVQEMSQMFYQIKMLSFFLKARHKNCLDQPIMLLAKQLAGTR